MIRGLRLYSINADEDRGWWVKMRGKYKSERSQVGGGGMARGGRY